MCVAASMPGCAHREALPTAWAPGLRTGDPTSRLTRHYRTVWLQAKCLKLLGTGVLFCKVRVLTTVTSEVVLSLGRLLSYD